MWAKRVMSGAGHAFKIFFLSCTAHASLRSARALHPHICKRRCIARGIHAQRTFTCGTPIMNPPAPRKIVHMSILANRDKTRRIRRFVTEWAGYTKFQVPVQVEVISDIKDPSALDTGAYMHIREGCCRNISTIRCSWHIKAIDTQVGGQSSVDDSSTARIFLQICSAKKMFSPLGE